MTETEPSEGLLPLSQQEVIVAWTWVIVLEMGETVRFCKHWRVWLPVGWTVIGMGLRPGLLVLACCLAPVRSPICSLYDGSCWGFVENWNKKVWGIACISGSSVRN